MGALSGSVTTVTTTVNITTEGSTDWIKWQSTAALNRKSGGGSLISDVTVAGVSQNYTNDGRTITWSDGTPTASGSDQNGVFNSSGGSSGYSFTAPADTGTRILIVHCGGFSSNGILTAHLSDSSAADYTDTGGGGSGAFDRNYTITYAAGSGSQTLTVTWINTQSPGGGNVTIQAAALQVSGGAAVFVPRQTFMINVVTQ